MSGLEHPDDIPALARIDSEGVAEQEMVGQVAMEAPAGMRNGRQIGFEKTPVALVSGEPEVDRTLSVMVDATQIAATRFQTRGVERLVVTFDGALGPLHVELRTSDGSQVALPERGLAPIGPDHLHLELVDVGRVVPDPGVGGAAHPLGCAAMETEDPVDVV